MTKTLFQPAERSETLGATVLGQIKEVLLAGRLMPGEQLSLRSTAAALGVSVMPVREAVNQLVADQALEVAPNRAVRVPVMSREQFEEVTKIRLEIEGFAVAEAAASIDARTIDTLLELNEALAQAMSREDGCDEVVLLNKTLHFTIYEASGMGMLVKMIESLWLRIGPVLNYDLRTGSERTRNRTAVIHHANLIKALQGGDAQAARLALHQDIQSAYQYILQKQYGDLAG